MLWSQDEGRHKDSTNQEKGKIRQQTKSLKYLKLKKIIKTMVPTGCSKVRGEHKDTGSCHQASKCVPNLIHASWGQSFNTRRCASFTEFLDTSLSAASVLSPGMGEFALEHFKIHFLGFIKSYGSDGCLPCWFSNIDVFRAHVSSAGLKTWGAQCEVQIL